MKIILLILSFIVIISCETENIVNFEGEKIINKKENKENLTKGYINKENFADSLIIDKTKQLNGIEPNRPICGYRYVYGWEFHHFEAMNSKHIGIWPRSTRVNDINKFRELKEKYGFSYFLLSNSWTEDIFLRAKEVGFQNHEIISQIMPYNYQ